MTKEQFRAGDPVFHPKCGFGIVSGRSRRDINDPIEESVANGAEDYYDIRLTQGGSLLVPVSRAESVGLRRLTIGLEAVEECLSSPAESLPEDTRERTAVLAARRQTAEPTALVEAVRDLIVQRRGQPLSKSEKTWLDKSYEQLSMEAALVDSIPLPEARAAIQEAVNRLSAV